MRAAVAALALVFALALPAAGVPVFTHYVVTGATLQQCGRAGNPPVVVTCESAQPASVVGSFTVITDEDFLGLYLFRWNVDIDGANEVYEEFLPSEMYGDPPVNSFSPNPPFEILVYTLTLGPGSAHMEAADYLYTGTGECTPQSCLVEFLRFDAVAVPEPTTALLATFGLAVLGLATRRTR